MKMEKKITVVDLITPAEKRAAEKRAKQADFINRMLFVMEDGKEYRCKEIASLLQAQGIIRGTSIQNITRTMRILFKLGLIKRTIKDGEPRTFEDLIQDEITVNGRKYYSEPYWGKRTAVPKIAYYSLA